MGEKKGRGCGFIGISIIATFAVFAIITIVIMVYSAKTHGLM